MLTVNIVCIGKLKENYLRMACAEYEKRLGAFCKLNLVELPEYKVPSNPSQAQIEKAIEEEGKSILSHCRLGSCFMIPMCIEGKLLSSEQLAEKLDQIPLSGISEVNFIIGGSFGLSKEVKSAAQLKLSMSPMTFPHQLARVMLLEQIYRAFQINSNGKYHK
ncbi:MAG: 23S rRNA (pseudouridine(1915)-N(3))-methyltransferase RlmH [Massiliimalia sp.]|jgi:23S rRNA (pseudouridine1915-N3)-methyltransferase